MPIEFLRLRDAQVAMKTCPHCGALFRPFLRGEVQRSPGPWWRPFWGPTRDYCALICWACKDIVGWES